MWRCQRIKCSNSIKEYIREVFGSQHGGQSMIMTFTGWTLSARGKKYMSIAFTNYCEEQGIKRFFTSPYLPQRNGFASIIFVACFTSTTIIVPPIATSKSIFVLDMRPL